MDARQQVIDSISEYFDVNEEEADSFVNSIEGVRYYKPLKIKTTLIGRMSIPFYLLVLLLCLFIILPIKWFITGEFHFRSYTKFRIFMKAWSDKCGI